MQTTAPTPSAIGAYASPSQPTATKMLQVMISVAIVMPEIGFDELPMRPVMRDDTVTKKKPKMTIRIAATKFHCIGMPRRDGKEEREEQRSDENDRQRHVAVGTKPSAGAGRGAEVFHALAERRDDRRKRARERNEPGGQNRARAGVADVGAPQLAAPTSDRSAGRSPAPAGTAPSCSCRGSTAAAAARARRGRRRQT